MVVDTNILIAYFNGEEQVVASLEQWKHEGRIFFISSLSITELLSFPALTPTELADAEKFLHTFVSIPVTDELAKTAAWLRRLYRLTTPDAAIAATAFLRAIPLVSRDRQFRKIGEITLIEL